MRSSAGVRPSRISQTMHSGPGIIGNIPPSRRPNAVRSMIGPNSAWTGNTIRPCDYPSKFGKSSLPEKLSFGIKSSKLDAKYSLRTYSFTYLLSLPQPKFKARLPIEFLNVEVAKPCRGKCF